MRVEGYTFLPGRNIYCHSPVLRLTLDLGKWAEKTTRDLPYLEERLFSLLPGLGEHHCSLDYPGGFRTRVQEGTFLGHVLEHMILELLALAGAPVVYGRTREVGRGGVYEIVVECPSPRGGREAAHLAVEVLNSLLKGDQPPDLGEALTRLRCIRAQGDLGPSTAALVKAAQKRGIPVQRLDDRSLIQLGYGKYQKRILATITAQTSCIGVDIAGDKTLTKKILEQAGIPVPPGQIVEDEEEALMVAADLGYPVVVKPDNGNQGKGVSLNLTTEEDIRGACGLVRQYSRGLLLEKQIPGRHYRVLVVGGRAVAAAERIPARVEGDGIHTVAQLVELTNRDPRRGRGHEKCLTKIKIDRVVEAVLKRQGVGLDHIPPAGVRVLLRENANLSTGGTAVDVTADMHPDNAFLAVRAAQAVGLDVAGVDIVTADIAQPLLGSGAIIEVNAAPGLRMHLYPSEGKGRDVAGEIIEHLFPPGSFSRVPLVSITGTNGKTTTARLVGHILRTAGWRVGMTTTEGVWMDDRCLLRGDTTGPWSARLVLSDPLTEAAVLETARGGILREGLCYDEADVGVITNISRDHLGQDGLEDVEDLAYVKSLVIEALRPGGCAVLNADDPLVVSLTSRVNSRLIFFSLTEGNVYLRRHLLAGQEGVFIRGDRVVVGKGGVVEELIAINDLPLAMKGRARHNVANVLAAVAACRALGLDIPKIAKALAGFKGDFSDNPGRLNLFRIGGYRVLLDYGHNPAAYRAILQTAQGLGARRLVGVIGVPGDRCDELILESGRIAGAGFQQLYIKEDVDLRGRMPGEVAALLRQGALAGGLRKDNIEIILGELEAVGRALTKAQAGDLVVIFYEKLEPLLPLIGATKVTGPSTRKEVEVKWAVGWGGD